MATNVALTGLARDMQARAETGRPIRIGLIGSGEMGTDIVTRVAHMPGIEIGAISELNLPNALKAVDIAYRKKAIRAKSSNAAALPRRWKPARSPSPMMPISSLRTN